MLNGTIFLTGGGTMNEESSSRMTLKTNVAKTFKKNPVVLLPDIITLSENSNLLAEQIAAFSEHSNVTILLQDQGSIDFAAEQYRNVRVMYVPDMIWMIGTLLPNYQPVIDVILLFRRDSEGTLSNSAISSLIETVNGKGLSAESWDFPFMGYPVYKDNEDFVWYNYTKLFPNKLVMKAKAEENMDIAPEFKTQIAVNLLSRARIIVTDRLHAIIIANLVDKPVVYFNEKSGKNELTRKKLTDVMEECTDSALNTFYENTASAAVSKAIKFLRSRA
jgi:exopolysaccharide biosynthesis predicted pyruvyltransferase EpsI